MGRIFCLCDTAAIRSGAARLASLFLGSTVERQQAVARARDKSLQLAQAKRNFGGRCYGYDNIWRKPDGTEQPGSAEKDKAPNWQTVYRINPVEAEVVRAMLRMYADGHGAKTIAYCVNGDPAHRAELQRYFGGQSPAGPRGATSWSANTIRDVLRNPRYTGNIPYGAWRKTYKRGTQRRERGNGVRPRLDALKREVLTAIGHYITPVTVRAAARRAVEMIRAKNAAAPDKTKQLRRDLAAAEAKVANYLTAIGTGGSQIASLVAELAKANAESPPVCLDELSDRRLEHALTVRTAHWREVLAGDPPLARQALRSLLASPILFAPETEGYRLHGATQVGALWAPESRVKMASPGGFEPPYSP